MSHNCIIISILISAGILGGVANFLLRYKLRYKKKECWMGFLKSLFVSICASLTIPLFLKILDNKLIEEAVKNPSNYFVLLGFCVLAAFFSKRFLEDLYAKMIKLEEKGKETQQKLEKAQQELKDAQAEINEVVETANREEGDLETTLETVSKTLPEKTLGIRNLSSDFSNDEVLKVVEVTLQSKFKFRTIKGVAKETGFPEDQVEKIFEFLEKENFAEKRKRESGEFVWKIIIARAKPLF
jgi:ABC-type multidrug transport system fused ATPase/permease subunit